MRDAVLRAGRGVWWFVRQSTGEAKWDEYLSLCREQGSQPMTRREFERRRSDHREAHPQSRCC